MRHYPYGFNRNYIQFKLTPEAQAVVNRLSAGGCNFTTPEIQQIDSLVRTFQSIGGQPLVWLSSRFGVNRNLLTYTNDLSAEYTFFDSSRSNSSLANPINGQQNCALVTVTTANNPRVRIQAFNFSLPAGNYTFSWYLHSSSTVTHIEPSVLSDQLISVNFGNRAVNSGEDVGGGWYRHQINFNLAVDNTNVRILYRLTNSLAATAPVGAYIHSFGFELELNSTASSFDGRATNIAVQPIDLGSSNTTAQFVNGTTINMMTNIGTATGFNFNSASQQKITTNTQNPSNFTICSFGRVTDNSTIRTVLGNSAANAPTIRTEAVGSTKIVFARQGNPPIITTSGQVGVGNWFFASSGYSVNQSTLNVRSANVNEYLTDNNTQTFGTGDFQIGGRQDLNFFMQGQVGEILMFDRKLTQTQENAIFDGMKGYFGLT